MDAAGRIVLADLEAGLGTLSRAEAGLVDVLLVVVEPNANAREVGRRALEMAQERKIAHVLVVANRVRNPADLALVMDSLPNAEVVAVPDDPTILEADRQGKAPLDSAPEAPAVRALSGLAERLLQRP